MPVEQGGLGLFDVEEFLSGQQAGWVLKAKKSSRDNWRWNLRSLCYGNVLCAGPDLKVHKNENFFGFDFEFCPISLLVMHK